MNVSERILLKRYAAFRSMVSRSQWLLLSVMAVFLVGSAVLGLPISFFIVALFVFLSGCLGASLSLVREFGKFQSSTVDPFAISQAGADTHTATGGVLALVFLLLLCAGVLGGVSEKSSDSEADGPFIELPFLPDLSGVGEKLEDVEKDTVAGVEKVTTELSPRKFFTEGVLDFRNLSLLLLFSFLAGYSEGWVFGILGRITRKTGMGAKTGRPGDSSGT